ncbi:hypothetical protein ABZT49_07710 [Methylobacterium sp. EM32]|uniref:hypothetical protein n=1 Tax=Methylobacterium sp. EM32 TaxID=3163481 RepID=UPI0033A42222
MPTPDDAEGVIILPRRTSFWAMATLVVGLAGQLLWIGSYAAKIDARLEDLAASDQRQAKRDDERYGLVIGRLESLERDRDRLVRLEEQVRIATDLLREIRQEIRPPPRR